MDASLIWYRARPDGELNACIAELLETLDAKAVSENTTINAAVIPTLLAQSLKTADITVIIGGMDIRLEDENIVTILSRCLALQLEKDELSRSHFIYDTLRGRVLPTFESAVLFPSANGGPEGMMLAAGSKTLLLLPWMERRHTDIIKMMCEHLPRLMMLEVESESAHEADSEPVSEENTLPDYIERAAAKHRAAAIKPDEELNELQLKARLSNDRKYFEPSESNQRISMPPAESYIGSGRSSSAAVMPVPSEAPVRQPSKKNRSSQLTMYILAVAMLLAVIGTSCYIAIYHYESGLLPDSILYQSELSELYADGGDTSILPQLALEEFALLYAENPDTRGYISIPGTSISMPIVQASSTDIDMYAEMDFYGNADSRGTLYFDAANRISFGADNSNLIVYGSSPSDGSMFAQLKNYTNADFLAAHPIINMDTLYEKAQWLVFSVCIVSQNTVSEFNYANTVFAGQNAHEAHLHNLYIRSLFYTETQVFPTDKVLTLVADTDEFTGAKLLVCARKLRVDEELPDKKGNVIANELALMPDIWYQLNGNSAPTIPALEFTTMRDTITAPIITDENGSKVYVYESIASTTTSTMSSTAGSGATGAETTTAPTTASTTLAPSTILPDMRITSGGEIITGPAAEVIAMIIEAEMGSDYNMEALKAQAVAAYTFYLYSGGSAKAPSFPTKQAGSRALEAAKAVAGQYMTYKGYVPYTPYYAISAGHSANNSDINGAELPYLTSVDCSVDKNVSGYRVVKEVSSLEVAQRVFEKKGIDLNTISDKSKWFEIIERDANGLYVTKVSVGGTVFKGNTLHLSILGYSCLRSPCFDIEYDAEGDKFIFTSYGYGTGVGMSQTGANEFAAQGHDYVWILRHFYTGVEFSNKQ